MSTIENTFEQWILEQLNARNWSMRKLAKSAGISTTHVSNVLSGNRTVKCDFVMAISKALGEPPEKLLRLAGFLPRKPASENYPTSADIGELVDMLPLRERQELYNFARWKIEEQKRSEVVKSNYVVNK